MEREFSYDELHDVPGEPVMDWAKLGNRYGLMEAVAGKLTPTAKTILDNVLKALQDAEEIWGPDDYEQLMQAVSIEVNTRLSVYRENKTNDKAVK